MKNLEFKNIIRVIKSVKNPTIFRRHILYKLIALLYRKNKGDYIFDEKWDNLIILDACRYDFFYMMFKKYNLGGQLEKRISRGAHTSSFLAENFKNDYYSDIIYISATPYVDMMLKGKLFKIISVWKDEWSEVYHTVLPEVMYRNTLSIINKYPGKKLIIHFLQPHYPYIENNIEIDALENLRETALTHKTKVKKALGGKKKDKFFALSSSEVYSTIDVKIHIRGYCKNLEYTLPYVKKLLKVLPGKTIITADHGEAFGEYIHPFFPIRYYGHRKGVRIPILVNVPWLIVNQEKEEIIDKKTSLEAQIISDKIKQLRDLGNF